MMSKHDKSDFPSACMITLGLNLQHFIGITTNLPHVKTKTLMIHDYGSMPDPCLVDLRKQEDNKGHQVCSKWVPPQVLTWVLDEKHVCSRFNSLRLYHCLHHHHYDWVWLNTSLRSSVCPAEKEWGIVGQIVWSLQESCSVALIVFNCTCLFLYDPLQHCLLHQLNLLLQVQLQSCIYFFSIVYPTYSPYHAIMFSEYKSDRVFINKIQQTEKSPCLSLGSFLQSVSCLSVLLTG